MTGAPETVGAAVVNNDDVMPPDDPGCFWHGAEPISPDVFRVCFECGHAFGTREEIIEQHRKAYAEARFGDGTLTDAEAGDAADTFCPYCVHDF